MNMRCGKYMVKYLAAGKGRYLLAQVRSDAVICGTTGLIICRSPGRP
jgi:hypothetical protein